MKRVGVLVGREKTFPEAIINGINEKGRGEVVAEYIKLDGVRFDAPPQYDLASLLNDRITDTVIKPHLVEELVRYYVDRRVEFDRTAARGDEFFEIYRLSAIQRDLKVVGRFYYLDQVKRKPGYMKFVPPTVRRLQRNLAELPHTRAILPLLQEHFEAML